MGNLSYIGDFDSSNGKIVIKNKDTCTFAQDEAKAISLGCNIGVNLPGSTLQNTNVNAVIFDNVTTTAYGGKKTTLAVGCAGGYKNTGLVVRGNVAITGDIANLGIPLVDRLPDSWTGFDHNTCIVMSATSLTLPTGESIRDWFGNSPNFWAKYGTGETSGMDAQVYDLYVAVASWHTSKVTIYGNSGGNTDYSNTFGTPLYGVGVDRTGHGRITLQPGRCAHFKKVRRQWFVVGVN